MIPNKTKKHKENYTTSELQKLAQKENFALFQLASIQSQLVHLMKIPGIGTANVEKIRLYCVTMKNNIKMQQQFRKHKRAAEKIK